MSKKWTRRGLVALLTACAALGFAAPSLGDTSRIRAIKDGDRYLWSKDFVDIAKGDRVVWKNPTGVNHTVTFYKGPGADKDTTINPGERTSKKFRKTGPYYYRCKIHSNLNDGECTGMCGHVHV